MTPIEIIESMLVLLEKPESWIKGAYAAIRHDDGGISFPAVASHGLHSWELPEVNCFCMLGAGKKITGKTANLHFPTQDWERGIEKSIKEILGYRMTIQQFNDDPRTTHSNVIDALTRTRDLLRADSALHAAEKKV